MKIFLKFFHYAIFLSILGFGSIHAPKATANDSQLPEDFAISGSVTITSISDGDSLRSGKLRIRLFGIDAPEKKQQCTMPMALNGIAAWQRKRHLLHWWQACLNCNAI